MTIYTVACEGDSISSSMQAYFYRYLGVNTVDPGVTDYGSALINRSHYWVSKTTPRKLVAVNYAIAGTRLATGTVPIAGRAATTLDLIVPTNKRNPNISGYAGGEVRKNILFLLAGTNVDAGDPAAHLANLATYVAARKLAHHDYVGLGTLPSRTDGIIANFDTSYQQPINTGIRNGVAGVDFVVDFAADAEIGAASAANNTDFFNADKIHQAEAGQLIMAARFTTEFNAFLATLPL